MRKNPRFAGPALVRNLCIAGSLFLAGVNLPAQPTNNPVLAAFPVSEAFFLNGTEYGNYSWTEAIQWSNVYDVTTDLTSAPFTGLSNVTKDDLPPNHPNADFDDITGDASDDLAIVNAAITQLSAAGGGVLYFPAGAYVFSENLVLKDGVVLRGADPVGVTDARNSGYDPGTDFFFPRLTGIVDDPDVPIFGKRMDPSTVAASSIPGSYINEADPAAIAAELTCKVEIDQTYPAGLTSSNYGIVNIDLHRAGIQFLQEYFSDGSIDRNATLFGSDYKNRMEGGNVVVFGNRLNNVVDLAWLLAGDPDFNPWQLWTNRVGPHIDIMVKENAIAANNRINDMHYDFEVNGASLSNSAPLLLVDSFGMPTGGDNNSVAFGDPDTDYTNSANVYLDRNGNLLPSFQGVRAGEPGLINSNNTYVLFRHTQGLGIAMNRSSRVGYAASGPSNPAGEPSLQRRGIVCRQNWIYITARVGAQVSGYGVELRDNVRVDSSGRRVWLNPDGRTFQGNNSATYEHRGFDLSGDNVFVNNNTYNVQRASIAFAGFPTIDGEGILIQQNDGQKPINNWTVTNNTGNSYIGLYKLESMRNCNISNNTVTGGEILIWALPNFFPGIARDMTFNNNNASGGINFLAGLLQPSSKTIVTNNSGGTINLADYDNSTLSPCSLLNDEHYVLWGNSATVSYLDSNAGIAGGAGDFPIDNLIDEAPVVRIVSPATAEELVEGVPITVQVDVETVGSVGNNSLDTVTLYDCSLLDPNQQIQNFAHRTDPNSVAGSTALTFNAGTGYWEASWIPTAAHLDYGLLVIEAVMTEQTVKDGVDNNPAIDRAFRDNSFAMIGFQDGKAFATGAPSLQIVASGTTPEISFGMVPGGTYMLQKSVDLVSWNFVSGQIVTNGNSKTVGTLSDSGAAPASGEKVFYRVIQR
jgi:hypothetical protein